MRQNDTRGPVWLVLPTYEEAANLEAIVAAARGNLASGSRILVVDDDSPDGTGQIADCLAEETGGMVEVLHRRNKEGLGPAYVAGFRHALAAGAGFVCQMDSDFSHDPADLPRLIAAAEAGADLAIGSRYVAGGGVVDWGLVRRAISRGGSLYARLVLGLDIHDLTGGFKCFRREVLEQLALGDLGAKGYGFQIELTYLTLQQGFKVVEVPILFRDRRAGSSKMSGAIVLEAAWRVPLLRVGVR